MTHAGGRRRSRSHATAGGRDARPGDVAGAARAGPGARRGHASRSCQRRAHARAERAVPRQGLRDRRAVVSASDAHARRHDRVLGDIVIASGVARRQARAAGHRVQTELRVLALHGLLHLLGYDHETDDGEMARARSAPAPQGRAARGLIERERSSLATQRGDDAAPAVPARLRRDLPRHGPGGVQRADAAVAAPRRPSAAAATTCSGATSTIRCSSSSRPACCSALFTVLAAALLARVTGVDAARGLPVLHRSSLVGVRRRLRAPAAAADRAPRSRARARRAAAVVPRDRARARAADARRCCASAPAAARTAADGNGAERRIAATPASTDGADSDAEDAATAGRPGARAAALDRRLPRDDGARGDDAAARHRRDRRRRRRSSELRALFREQQYSRMPVYSETLDNIVGLRVRQGPDRR